MWVCSCCRYVCVECRTTKNTPLDLTDGEHVQHFETTSSEFLSTATLWEDHALEKEVVTVFQLHPFVGNAEVKFGEGSGHAKLTRPFMGHAGVT